MQEPQEDPDATPSGADDAPSDDPAEEDAEPEVPRPPAPVEVSPPPPPEGSFDQFLEEAKQRYFRGDREGALALLESLHRRLDAGEDVDWGIASEATFYLGEVYYKLDRSDDARTVFRWLLERDPEVQISPYHHPIDVRGLFYEVKTAVLSERGSEPPEPPVVAVVEPVPLWGYAPFGVPQFAQGRTGAGIVYGSLQVGLGTASLVLWERLRQLNVLNNPRWPPEEVAPRVNTLRYGVQWPLTAAFYGTWIISAVDGSIFWRRQQRRATTVTVLPTPQGVGLTVGGRL